jgi:hypothetical protein
VSKAVKLAEKLGVTLGPGNNGLSVNGHHGGRSISGRDRGCGTYNLILNLTTKTVDCAECGAVDLVRAASQ